MPKTTTITKEMIINSTFDIVREEGFYNISARKIAKVCWAFGTFLKLIERDYS